MNRQVLFIQGGGEGGYEADKALATTLQAALGKGYTVHYPEIKADEAAPGYGWLQQIDQQLAAYIDEVIVVGHSFGASMILKYLSENQVDKKVAGIFLIATPYWDGDEDWQAGLKLQENFAARLPVDLPIFFYHCHDDEEVPFNQLDPYRQKLPQAGFREIKQGGHQLNNDLAVVAEDITSLQQRPGQ